MILPITLLTLLTAYDFVGLTLALNLPGAVERRALSSAPPGFSLKYHSSLGTSLGLGNVGDARVSIREASLMIN